MIITTATSIEYGNYKALQGKAETVRQLVTKHVPRIKMFFGWDCDLSKVKILIRPIKGRTRGRAITKCINGKNVTDSIELDPRIIEEGPKRWDNIIDTLAHELCHVQQISEGRLEHVFDSTGTRIFENRRYRKATTYKQYFNQPWEIEARAAGAKYLASTKEG